MSIPLHGLSVPHQPAELLWPDDQARSDLVDYEIGGIALNDPNEGLDYQMWTVSYNDPDVIVTPENGPGIVLFSISGIKELSIAFDQNMNPNVAYVIGFDGQAWLWWYDTIAEDQVHWQLDSDVKRPRLGLDDKRPQERASSDIILAYMRGSSLYTREQRDRYTVEYLMAENIPEERVFNRIGMAKNLRLMFIHVEQGTAPNQNENLLPVLDAGFTSGWIDLSLFPTVTFEDLFGQSVDGPDFTKVVDIGSGVKVLVRPTLSTGPIQIGVVDSLDMNYLIALSASINGGVSGGLNYQNWEITGGLQFWSHYDSYLVIASDTGKARLRMMNMSPVLPDYGVKIDPQKNWMISAPEMALSIEADIEVGDPLSATVLAKLEAFWEGEETSGTRFDSHNSHDMEVVASISATPGVIGNAIDFTGSPEAKTPAGWPTTTDSFAMAMFVYVRSQDGGDFIVHRAGYNNGGATVPGDWGFYRGGSGFYFQFDDSGSFNAGGGSIVADPTVVINGEIYFAYFHYNASNDEMAISIDNGAKTIGALTHTFFQAGNSLRFGRLTSTYPNQFDGWLDQIMYFNEPLTDDELAWVYNNGNGRQYSDLQ